MWECEPGSHEPEGYDQVRRPQSSDTRGHLETPEEYFEKVETGHLRAVASQWIPMEHHLWKIESDRDFPAARRELLAHVASLLLDGLLAGTEVPVAAVEYPAGLPTATGHSRVPVPVLKHVGYRFFTGGEKLRRCLGGCLGDNDRADREEVPA